MELGRGSPGDGEDALRVHVQRCTDECEQALRFTLPALALDQGTGRRPRGGRTVAAAHLSSCDRVCSPTVGGSVLLVMGQWSQGCSLVVGQCS